MKLLVEPGDGVQPLVSGIAKAKKTIQIAIFRFDQREVERALANAVSRGVSVHALIAHTNRTGEESLRKLEMRLLAAGITVARTADDLVRYHGKFMIIDRRELYLLAFNLTLLDIERSRSFGIITRNRHLVAEAVSLFEADTQRHRYEPGPDNFVVSPVNARKRLAALIKSAKKELMIYDLKISDQAMILLLGERAKAGVSVRIIGRMTRQIPGVAARKLPQMRLHSRTIVVDGRTAFIGSQSLRENELDTRREVGIIFKDPEVVKRIVKVFRDDWVLTEKCQNLHALNEVSVAKVAKKAAKAASREIPDVIPLLNDAVNAVAGEKTELESETVKEAVQEAVEQAVRDVVEDVVQEHCERQGAA